MKLNRRDFIVAASAFVAGCRSACAPRKIAADAKVNTANICARLQLSSLKWDPKAERFVGPYADEANRFLSAEYHNGWSLDA